MTRPRGTGPRLRGFVLCLVLLLPAYSAAEKGDRPAALRVAVISDLNSSYGTVGHHVYVRRAVVNIIDLDPDLVIITGDMVAGQIRNPADAGVFADMWAAFHEEVSEPLVKAGIPLAVTPGNHDASALAAFRAEREQYAQQWQGGMTDLHFVERQGFPFRYAFELAGVLFVALDVTTTGVMDDEQFAWLEALLTRSQGQYRETVVFSHLPVWPVAVGRLDEATLDRRLHSLLVANNVGVYLSGHHHAFYPGVNDGIAYISQACLGSGPRNLIGSDSAREPRGFTFLEFDLTSDAQRLRVASMVVPHFESTVDWATLPREIVVDGANLLRADLADVAVAPLPLDAIAAGASKDLVDE